MVGSSFLVGNMVQLGSHGIVLAVIFTVKASWILLRRFEAPDIAWVASNVQEQTPEESDLSTYHNPSPADSQEGKYRGYRDVVDQQTLH
jgi:hypothetical protein